MAQMMTNLPDLLETLALLAPLRRQASTLSQLILLLRTLLPGQATPVVPLLQLWTAPRLARAPVMQTTLPTAPAMAATAGSQTSTTISTRIQVVAARVTSAGRPWGRRSPCRKLPAGLQARHPPCVRWTQRQERPSTSRQACLSPERRLPRVRVVAPALPRALNRPQVTLEMAAASVRTLWQRLRA